MLPKSALSDYLYIAAFSRNVTLTCMQVSSLQRGKGATYQTAHDIASMCTNIKSRQEMTESTRKTCGWRSLAKSEDVTVMESSWVRYAVIETTSHYSCSYSICSLVLGLYKLQHINRRLDFTSYFQSIQLS